MMNKVLIIQENIFSIAFQYQTVTATAKYSNCCSSVETIDTENCLM